MRHKPRFAVLTIWDSIRSFFAVIPRDDRAAERLVSGSPSRYATAARVIIVALVIEAQDRILLASIGRGHHWDMHFADTAQAALAAANELSAPIILYDRDLPGTEWRNVVQTLASSPHSACVILISKVSDDYLWNEVARTGGYDVLPKPLQEADVVRAVKLASSYWNSTIRAATL